MPAVEIPRDRWGKPLIIPPGGGKPVAYYRASSFGDVIDDRSNLEKYLRRMAVKGLTLRDDLTLAVSTTSLTEKGRLNGLVEEAIEAAGGGRKASIGTSLHSLTEMQDRGETLPPYPAEYRADLAAYAAATAPLTHTAVERFVVCDELGVAGTPDRVTRHDVPLPFVGVTLDPAVRIGDLKTGGHPDYLGGHAVQLAIYAHSEFYDPATGERTPITDTTYSESGDDPWGPFVGDVSDVDQQWGLIFHAPSGEGTCDLYAVDLVAGWEGALLAADIRAWRRRKGLAVKADVSAKAA